MSRYRTFEDPLNKDCFGESLDYKECAKTPEEEAICASKSVILNANGIQLVKRTGVYIINHGQIIKVQVNVKVNSLVSM